MSRLSECDIVCHNLARIFLDFNWGKGVISKWRVRQQYRQIANDMSNPIFLNETYCVLIKISLKFVPKDPIKWKGSFGSFDDLATNRRQAIIWTYDHPVNWYICASLDLDGLNRYQDGCYIIFSQQLFHTSWGCSRNQGCRHGFGMKYQRPGTPFINIV